MANMPMAIIQSGLSILKSEPIVIAIQTAGKIPETTQSQTAFRAMIGFSWRKELSNARLNGKRLNNDASAKPANGYRRAKDAPPPVPTPDNISHAIDRAMKIKSDMRESL